MRSLKGYALKQWVSAEEQKLHPTQGNSMKIGSSFVCHLVLKELKDVHFVISVNEHGQVMVQNMSQASPISVNGVVVSGKTQLEVGDAIQLLGHRFEWHRDQSPDSVSDADLEASYQINENPSDNDRCRSEPRVVNHKWVAFSKQNQSIHFGEGEVSSTTEESSDIEETETAANKENQRPSSTSIPETEDDSQSEAETEKTILNELNEHSALIDLSTPEPAQQSVNFIDLNTPAVKQSHTPLRGTPKTTSKLLKKILDPRLSMSSIESDFKNIHHGSAAGQSTPMLSRPAGTSQQHRQSLATIEMSDINESTEASTDQSTIISNSVRPADEIVTMPEEDEVPETQPEAEIEELFEDAVELAQSDSGLLPENALQLSCTEVDENGDEYIPATQQMNATDPADMVNMSALPLETIGEDVEPLTVDSPLIFDDDDEEEVIEDKEEEVETEKPSLQVVEPASPAPVERNKYQDEMDQEEEQLKAVFTPRKSMRTPKKIDHNQCCTPKSLSKVLLEEGAQRRSPRVSRMNLSLRMESNKNSTPVPAKNLSKSLMVSTLQRSTKKSLARTNKSIVEIADDSDDQEEEEEDDLLADDGEDEQGIMLLAAETTVKDQDGTTTEVGNTDADADDSVIVIGSQEEERVPERATIAALEINCESPAIEDAFPDIEPVPTSTTEELMAAVEALDNDEIITEDIIEEVTPTEDDDCVEEVIPTEDDDCVDEVIEEQEEQLEELTSTVTIETEAEAVEEPSTNNDENQTPVAEENEEQASLQMYKSPMKKFSQANSPIKGGSLQKTPKGKALVSEQSPRLNRSPLQNVSNMVGVRELFKTPKADVEKNLTGLREMMMTPQTVMFARAEMVGLKEMMKTPGRLFNEPNMVGLKEMMKTPKATPVTNLVGVKELVQTPASKTDINYVGVKELVNTPVPAKDVRLLGVRELLQTPKAVDRDTRMIGVKELLNTPAPATNVNTMGVKEMFNTPQVTLDVNMVGVGELLKTPAVRDTCEMPQTPKPGTSRDATVEVFKTPAPLRIAKQMSFEEATEEEEEEGVEEEAKKEEEEEPILDTSAELFDKMMNRKSLHIKHTYSRHSPIKSEAVAEKEPKITPEKKEEVERWVESIMVVAGTGETKTIVNNNLQVLSDRYSNVTPSQGTKAESVLFKAEVVQEQQQEEPKELISKVAVAEVTVTVEQQEEHLQPEIIECATEPVAPTDEQSKSDEMETIAEETPTTATPEDLVKPEEVEAMEENKPKRGVRAAVVAKLVSEETTPRTPLRTRRNLKADLEDTPKASPRTRRAASVKLEESITEVKVTPARRGRKPKVEAMVEKPVKVAEKQEEAAEHQKEIDDQHKAGEPEVVAAAPVVSESAKKEPSEAPEAPEEKEKKRPGRAKAVKKVLEEETAPSATTPQKRGRRPKAVEQLAEADSEPKATPTRRGRKPAAVSKVVEEEKKPEEEETPAAQESSALDEEKTVEAPVKRRGRPAAVKKQESVAEQSSPLPTEKATPKPGRGRRVAVAKVDYSESENTTTEAEDVPKARAPAARGGRKKKEPVVSTEVESESSTVATVTEEEEPEKGKPKAGRGRKAATTKKGQANKRKDEEPLAEGAKATSVKRGKLDEKEAAEESVKLGDNDDEPVLVKKPTRGRKAALLAQDESTAVNESVTSTPGRRRGARKPAAAAAATAEAPGCEDKPESVDEHPPAVKRAGRGKRTVAAADVAESPKRAKKQDSEDTDESHVNAESVAPAAEEKPERRGRAKKEVSEDTPSVKPVRGRKGKAAAAATKKAEEEHEESEKELTSDEADLSVKAPVAARGGKRTANKRAVEEKPDAALQEEEGEPSRKTRATRRRN